MPESTLARWKMIRIFRCDFGITKSVPDIRTLSKFFPYVRRSRGTRGPSPQGVQSPQRDRGPTTKKTEIFHYYKKYAWHGAKRDEIRWQFRPTRLHSLTAAGRGSGGREPISPGEGEGTGSNSLPRTIRIAVWEIFSEGLRGLGNFFRGPSRYRKIILDQKILIVRARAPPHRRYAKSQNFLTTTNLVQVCFGN